MAQATVTELLAHRVRRLRTERGWSAQKLSEQCAKAGLESLTRGTIAKIESGARKTVAAEEVAVLAKVLGVTATDLLAPGPGPSGIARLDRRADAHGDLAPEYLQLISELDRIRLHNWLARISVRELPTVIRRAAGPSIPIPASDNAWDVFAYLTDFNAGVDGVPPAILFLDLLATQVDEGLKLNLIDWTTRHARRLRIESALDARRNAGSPVRTERRLHLLIAVEPDGPDGTRYQLSFWRQDDPDEWPPARGDIQTVGLDELELRVDEVVVAAERAWAGHSGAAVLEFLLPRSLLHLPVHRWHKEHDSGNPRPLCLDYPIVVRSLERMRSAHWHRVWHKRWQSLIEDPSAGRVHFGEKSETSEAHRIDAVLSDPQWALTVLTEPPPPEPRPGAGTDELTAALRAGIPVLVWHPEASPDDVREIVAQLAKDDGMSDLPARTLESRRAAFLPSAAPFNVNVVRDLVVLWDDPTRLVVLDQPPMVRVPGLEPGTSPV